MQTTAVCNNEVERCRIHSERFYSTVLLSTQLMGGVAQQQVVLIAARE
jgi:hypothetical protein